MKKALAAAALLLLGLPQMARADDECGGRLLDTLPLREPGSSTVHGYISLYYNYPADRYCSKLRIAGERDGVFTEGLLQFQVCAAGLNANGYCKTQVQSGPRDEGRRRNHFGPIRVAADNRCVRVDGSLHWYAPDQQSPHIPYNTSDWYCGKGVRQ